MSEVQPLDSAAYRLVVYPSPDGSERPGPVVEFPGSDDMSESEFHDSAATAWMQLLTEHVKNEIAPSEEAKPYANFLDKLAEHVLAGDMDQAKQVAQAWQDGRKAA